MSDPHRCAACGRPLEQWACEAGGDRCRCGPEVLCAMVKIPCTPEEKGELVAKLRHARRGIGPWGRGVIRDFIAAD